MKLDNAVERGRVGIIFLEEEVVRGGGGRGTSVDTGTSFACSDWLPVFKPWIVFAIHQLVLAWFFMCKFFLPISQE